MVVAGQVDLVEAAVGVAPGLAGPAGPAQAADPRRSPVPGGIETGVEPCPAGEIGGVGPEVEHFALGQHLTHAGGRGVGSDRVNPSTFLPGLDFLYARQKQ